MNLAGIRFDFYQLIGIINSKISRKTDKYYDIVIVRVDAIGDYVIWRDSLSAYKSKYHDKEVLLICADIVKPLAENESFFTDIVTFNRKRVERDMIYLLSIQNKLLSIRAGIVINPSWQRHRISDFFTKSIKATEKIAYRGAGTDGFVRRYYNGVYTTLIDNPNTHSEITATEYFTKTVISPEFKYGYSKLESSESCIPVDGNYIVVAISTSNDIRSWEVEKFAEVIETIPPNYSVVLCGAGKGDLERGNAIISIVGGNRIILNYINRTSLQQLVSVISHSSLVVGNDSSAVHIAAACHIPSICIAPGAHLGRFVPYPNYLPYNQYSPRVVNHSLGCDGCGYNCIRPVHDTLECVKRIEVADVQRELNILLQELN